MGMTVLTEQLEQILEEGREVWVVGRALHPSPTFQLNLSRFCH